MARTRQKCGFLRVGGDARPPHEQRAGYLPTNVVTLVAPSAAVKVPPVTATAVFMARLSLDDVT